MPARRRFSVDRFSRDAFRVGQSVVLALVTPFLEKNQSKLDSVTTIFVPLMFSMTRVIVCLFAGAMLRQVSRAGITGWPEATLCIAIVLALPILNALERVRPRDVLSFGERLLQRFGEGAIRQVDGLYRAEPSKYDDHRSDEEAGPYKAVRSCRR
ncbi:MAG TPA: hypothetical protein VHE78_12660 [Gemmatimonadaceae bacterium]|nr:hypothetical protein [Gemmatimonadaceae bacterium]